MISNKLQAKVQNISIFFSPALIKLHFLQNI